MPKLNPYLVKENYKKVEEIREIDYKVLSYEEFVNNYENNEGVNESYENELANYSNIGQGKVCGPMYRASSSSNNFSINYSFNHEGNGEKLFFEEAGV